MTITNITIKTRESLGNTYYMIIGDTKRFVEQEILFEGINLNECKEFLKRECIPDYRINAVIIEHWNKEETSKYGSPKTDSRGYYLYKVTYTDGWAYKREYVGSKNDRNAIEYAKESYIRNTYGMYVDDIEKYIDPDNRNGGIVTIYNSKATTSSDELKSIGY